MTNLKKRGNRNVKVETVIGIMGETKMLEPSHRLRERCKEQIRDSQEMSTAKIKGVKKC